MKNLAPKIHIKTKKHLYLNYISNNIHFYIILTNFRKKENMSKPISKKSAHLNGLRNRQSTHFPLSVFTAYLKASAALQYSKLVSKTLEVFTTIHFTSQYFLDFTPTVINLVNRTNSDIDKRFKAQNNIFNS